MMCFCHRLQLRMTQLVQVFQFHPRLHCLSRISTCASVYQTPLVQAHSVSSWLAIQRPEHWRSLWLWCSEFINVVVIFRVRTIPKKATQYPVPNIIGSCRFQYPVPIGLPILVRSQVSRHVLSLHLAQWTCALTDTSTWATYSVWLYDYSYTWVYCRLRFKYRWLILYNDQNQQYLTTAKSTTMVINYCTSLSSHNSL